MQRLLKISPKMFNFAQRKPNGRSRPDNRRNEMSCTKTTYLLAASCLLLTACIGNRRAEQALQRAAQLLPTAPDSALRVLQRIGPNDISRHRTRAEYALLYIEALDRNDMPVGNDSLVRMAHVYYRHDNDPRKRFLAEYYHAAMLQNRKEDARALAHFLRIEDDGRQLDDPALPGALCARIGDIYRAHCNYSSMLQYAREASTLYRRAGEKRRCGRTLHDMGDAHFHLRQYDSALVCYTRSLRIAEAERDTAAMQRTLAGRALALVCGEQPDEACTALWQIRRRLHRDWCDRDRAIMVLAHLTADRLDSARRYLREAEMRIGPDSPSRELLNDVAAEVHFRSGDYRKAAEELRRSAQLQDSLERRAVRNSLDNIRSDVLSRQHKMAQRRLRGMRHNLVLVIALAVVSMLFVGFVAYVFYRKRRFAVLNYMSIIDEINNAHRLMLLKLRTQHRSETEELQQLVRSRYEVIDFLGSTYYERQGTNEQRAIYNKVKELLDTYASDAKGKQEIENAVNMCHDNAMTKLRTELPRLKEAELDLLRYIFAGFSLRVISLFTGDTPNYIAVRKSRLKAKIKDSDAPSKELFLKLMQ